VSPGDRESQRFDEVLRQPGHVGEVLPRPQHEDRRGQGERQPFGARHAARFHPTPRLLARRGARLGTEGDPAGAPQRQRPAQEADSQRQPQPPQGGPAQQREGGLGQQRCRELAHRNPGRGQRHHQRQVARPGMAVCQHRPGDGEDREGHALDRAGAQYQQPRLGNGQRDQDAERHEAQRGQYWRHGAAPLHQPAQAQRQHQPGGGVDRHEGAGQCPVVAMGLQKQRQRRRQLELLIGREARQTQAEGNSRPVALVAAHADAVSRGGGRSAPVSMAKPS